MRDLGLTDSERRFFDVLRGLGARVGMGDLDDVAEHTPMVQDFDDEDVPPAPALDWSDSVQKERRAQGSVVARKSAL